MPTLQQRIKERRSELGFTLREVADILGVKEATMQRYESGEIKNIKHDTIVCLAKILKCTPQYLMGWSDMVVEPDKIENLNYFLQPNLFSTDEDFEIINSLNQLNKKGKKELVKYSKYLITNDEYNIKTAE